MGQMIRSNPLTNRTKWTLGLLAGVAAVVGGIFAYEKLKPQASVTIDPSAPPSSYPKLANGGSLIINAPAGGQMTGANATPSVLAPTRNETTGVAWKAIATGKADVMVQWNDSAGNAKTLNFSITVA